MTSVKVEVDYPLCETNAVCMGIVPEVFDIGDDDQLTVLQTEINSADEAQVREAARQCPRQAIGLAD